ncbi:MULTISPECIES: protoglobin domain-containing protein [Streptomyces]|uniref:Protogloblin ApPgb n=1 Tax=Streptomyces dengpaensis TaxID=2049881 RepID=A0ABM6T0L9_9ACTN|nr:MULTISPECIES: protoglobin domain-containing protein [Streptomyces]AVH60480.1 protogloblin ApPgb [Streptomyces dengpaensis]PIB07601.1 protogloblin ApPgb [Streptomyces sp. HG99]
MSTQTPAGYTYGSTSPSPVTRDDLAKLEASVLFTEEDEQALRMAGDVLEDQVEDVLDVWYGFVASHPHLVAYFATPDGTVLQDYLTRVRGRFGQWILDTCRRPYDDDWLSYAHEIGLRHTKDKKNRTDGADSAPYVPLRYMVAFIYPITATMRQFLANKGHDDEAVERMHQAWFKSVTLQTALWLQPYAGDQW